jgi:hypothetical protein
MPIRLRFVVGCGPKPKAPRLTPTQRKILYLGTQCDFMVFGLGHRNGLVYKVMEPTRAGHVAIVINAYSYPHLFMERNGWIESTGAPYTYRLTPAGRLLAANLDRSVLTRE